VIKRLREKIVDPRYLEIINKFLKTGIQDPITKAIKKTTLGIPQGGILSPILCNIVLHDFDECMNRQIDKYNQGKKRGHNREYQRLEYRRRKSNSVIERRKLLTEMRKIGN
jgi:RNA-directed DNA polymerase